MSYTILYLISYLFAGNGHYCLKIVFLFVETYNFGFVVALKNKNLISSNYCPIYMKCPYCGYEETQVIDSRDTENLEATRRRRECSKCKKRFTTYERVEEAEIVVVKKDGKRERYERQKLINGMLKACEKRSIPLEKIEKLVDDVESDLRKRDSVEVDSKVIGNIVMKKLKSLDKVAYIRFASVYLEFEDLDRFEEELDKLQKK